MTGNVRLLSDLLKRALSGLLVIGQLNRGIRQPVPACRCLGGPGRCVQSQWPTMQ
jgi:hypothetical protein